MKIYFLCGLMIPIFVSAAIAQQKLEDPFSDKPAPEARQTDKEDESETGFTLTFEVFSVPLPKVAKLKREGAGDAAIYRELVAAVKAGDVSQDKFMEVRTVEGTPGSIEQVREYIYPTEFDPAEIGKLPKQLPEGFKDYDRFITPASPASFETKNLGDTVEFELEQHPKDRNKLTGRLDFAHVRLLAEEKWGKDEAEVKVPRFDVGKIRAALSLTVGQPLHAGSMGDPTPGRKGRVWVAFVTVFRDQAKK